MKGSLLVLILILIPEAAWAWTLAGPTLGGWETRHLEIHYSPGNCLISESELVTLIDQAIGAWNAVPDIGLTLSRAGTASSATASDFLHGLTQDVPLVVCDTAFQADNQADPDQVPALTQLGVAADGHLNNAGILINAQAGTFAELSRLSASQQLIALTHELGHVLGLGHSGAEHSLMYFSIADKTAATVTQDDMDGAEYLYPRDEFVANPFGCAAAHGARTPWSLLWALAYLAGTLAAGRCLVSRARPSKS